LDGLSLLSDRLLMFFFLGCFFFLGWLIDLPAFVVVIFFWFFDESAAYVWLGGFVVFVVWLCRVGGLLRGRWGLIGFCLLRYFFFFGVVFGVWGDFACLAFALV